MNGHARPSYFPSPFFCESEWNISQHLLWFSLFSFAVAVVPSDVRNPRLQNFLSWHGEASSLEGVDAFRLCCLCSSNIGNPFWEHAPKHGVEHDDGGYGGGMWRVPNFDINFLNYGMHCAVVCHEHMYELMILKLWWENISMLAVPGFILVTRSAQNWFAGESVPVQRQLDHLRTGGPEPTSEHSPKHQRGQVHVQR